MRHCSGFYFPSGRALLPCSPWVHRTSRAPSKDSDLAMFEGGTYSPRYVSNWYIRLREIRLVEHVWHPRGCKFVSGMYVGVTYERWRVAVLNMIPKGDSTGCAVCSWGLHVTGGGVDMGITGPEHGFPGSCAQGYPCSGPTTRAPVLGTRAAPTLPKLHKAILCVQISCLLCTLAVLTLRSRSLLQKNCTQQPGTFHRACFELLYTRFEPDLNFSWAKVRLKFVWAQFDVLILVNGGTVLACPKSL